MQRRLLIATNINYSFCTGGRQMQLLSIAITLVVVVLVSAMILKKYKPHAILLGGGIVLLLSAQFLGINNIITDVEKSTGFWLFDVLN